MVLHKKLKRDLLSKKDSNIAVIILIAIGVLIFSSFDMLAKNLDYSQNSFYNNYGFADGFIDLRAIPYNKISSLKHIEGIEQIEGRIVDTVRMNFAHSRDDIYLKLLSYDDGNNQINRFLLQEGSYPSPGKYELLLDSKFARFQNLKVGDRINILKHGVETSFQVSGLGASPEFIYAIKDIRDILPDYDTYGIAATSLDTMENLTDSNLSYNNIVFTLKEGYEFFDISDPLNSRLRHYHIYSIFPRKSQISHVIVDGEVEEAKGMSRFLPSLFLFISSMIQVMMLERLVQSQRTQIGILKSFGYSNRTIQLHYMQFSIILGVIGSLLGMILSIPALSSFVKLYDDFFNFPYITEILYPSSFLSSFFFGTIFSVIAGYMGAKKILLLSPLEAFKAEEIAPVQKRTLLEHFTFLFHTFGIMSLRNLSRNRRRSFFVFLGITMSFALTSTVFMLAAIRDSVISEKYNYSEVYDGKVHFQGIYKKSSALQEFRKYEEILELEPLLEVPVTVSHRNVSKDVTLIGMQSGSALYRILDRQKKIIPLSDNDVFLSQRLADVLSVKQGDEIYVKSNLMKKPKKIPLTVTKIISQNVGMNLYMQHGSAEELLDQKDIATSLILKSNKEFIESLRKKYEESDRISNIIHSDNIKHKMMDFLQTFAFMTYIFVVFGVIMCFIVIYNSYIINIGERSRELSSLLVLGLSRREVSEIVSLEQRILAFVSMLAGIPLTKLFLIYISKGLSDDTFTVPTKLTFSGFLWAFLCVSGSIFLAQRFGRKKINELIIVEVLKERG